MLSSLPNLRTCELANIRAKLTACRIALNSPVVHHLVCNDRGVFGYTAIQPYNSHLLPTLTALASPLLAASQSLEQLGSGSEGFGK